MARHILPAVLIPGLLAAAMSSSFAADPVKVRVASVSVPPSMHTLYMQVAYEEGIYRRNGLEVDDILQMNSGPLVTQALAAGRVDVADTDAEGVLNAAAAGFKLVAVSAPAQYLSYLIMVQPEIKTLKDLAGKPFAISRPGALSQYLMFPVLERAGLAKTDISWIPIGGPSERRLALVNNRVKGALLHLDYALVAQRDSNVVELERVVRGNPDYPHELLVIRRELAEKQPQVAIAITRSIIEACRFMVANRDRTLEIYRKYTGETDMKLAGAAYDALLAMRGWGVNGGMTRKGQDYVAKLAVENGAKSIPLESWTDFRFQEEALKQIGGLRNELSDCGHRGAAHCRCFRRCGISLVASLPDGWITSLITQYAGDARFRMSRSTARNRRSGCAPGRSSAASARSP
jgi:ABC-type nitrate/sulfonate/bicarbonate transport systems, periplasmic components